LNLSASLHLTPKGEDEIKRRVFKLDMKKRSLMILLEKPQTVEYLAHKTVLPREEFLSEINTLVHDGFVALGSDTVPSTSVPGLTRSTPGASTGTHLNLDDEVILSEAKFLLTDFCVDSFGTQSQVFVDGIRASKSVKDLRPQLNAVFAATEKFCPKQLPTLLNIVTEINATA